ncbi:MAG TPA: hypothetical protein PLV70_12105, partial [Flavobacteriales bacterium]|nr:hypothetical protein [Flavobacteriales bacterium]
GKHREHTRLPVEKAYGATAVGFQAAKVGQKHSIHLRPESAPPMAFTFAAHEPRYTWAFSE